MKMGKLYRKWQKYDLSLKYFLLCKEQYLKFGKNLSLEFIPLLEDLANIYIINQMYQKSNDHYQEILIIQKFNQISTDKTVKNILNNQ